MQEYNFGCWFVWVWNVVSPVDGRTYLRIQLRWIRVAEDMDKGGESSGPIRCWDFLGGERGTKLGCTDF